MTLYQLYFALQVTNEVTSVAFKDGVCLGITMRILFNRSLFCFKRN